MINIRLAVATDTSAIWDIFQAVIQAGDTYVYPADTPVASLADLWLAPAMHTFVAEEVDTTTGFQRILGTYILKPNYPGRGSHIANASYMVHHQSQGLGIGTAMASHSLIEARRLGFRAMQFNLVISTNRAAIHLWQKMGFRIIGTIPEAFEHKRLGYVDAHIMYQSLRNGDSITN